MEKDERLLPLPTTKDIQLSTHEYPAAYSPIYDEEEFSDQRSLREYFNVIYKRLPLILALSILVTAVVAFYMYRQPSIYEAQTTMIIEPPKPKVQSKDAININFGSDINYNNTQLRLLQNPDLMRSVVIRLQLQRDANLFANKNKGLLSSLRSLFSSEKNKPEKESSLPVLNENSEKPEQSSKTEQIALTPEERQRADSYAGILLGGLRVEQIERTNLVNVTIQSDNPDLAPKVADMTAELFIEENIDRETKGAKKVFDELSKSIEDLKDTIAAKELEYIKEMQSSNLPLREGKGNDFLAERLQTISSNLLAAEDDRRKLEARYNAAVQANNRGEGSNIPELTEQKIYQEKIRLFTERKAKLQDQIREIDTQIQGAETELAALLSKYTEEFPKVKEVNAKIEKLKETKGKTEKEVTELIERDQKKLESEAVSGALVTLKSQLDSALRRESQLRASYIKEAESANLQGQAETKLTTLKREIETQRSLLDTYTQRQKEQELAISSGRPENLKISTYAIKPGGPIGPQRNRNIIVAFLISLAAGIGLAFLLDYLDDSIRTSDDVGRHLGLPTLALIPHQSSADKRKLALLPKNGNGTTSTAMIALEDTRSAMAEAYRHLRTSLALFLCRKTAADDARHFIAAFGRQNDDRD